MFENRLTNHEKSTQLYELIYDMIQKLQANITIQTKHGRKDGSMRSDDRRSLQQLKMVELQQDFNIQENIQDLHQIDPPKANVLIKKFPWLKIYCSSLFIKTMNIDTNNTNVPILNFWLFEISS